MDGSRPYTLAIVFINCHMLQEDPVRAFTVICISGVGRLELCNCFTYRCTGAGYKGSSAPNDIGFADLASEHIISTHFVAGKRLKRRAPGATLPTELSLAIPCSHIGLLQDGD